MYSKYHERKERHASFLEPSEDSLARSSHIQIGDLFTIQAACLNTRVTPRMFRVSLGNDTINDMVCQPLIQSPAVP